MRRAVLAATLAWLASACGNDHVPTSALQGTAQKGPFQIGSTVLIQELDDHLTPTGRTIVSETTDAFGSFGLQGVTSAYVEILVSGYFLQEFGGSPGTTTLRAYASTAPPTSACSGDGGTTPTVNVNVLTHLQGARLAALVSKGLSFADAESQSRSEVLAAFHMPAQAVEFQCMDLEMGRDADAILLAVAALANDAGELAALAAGSGTDAQVKYMTLFLDEVRSDLADNGAIDDPVLLTNLRQASYNESFHCPSSSDTPNDVLAAYYQQGGRAYTALPYWEFLDADWDGTINRDDATPGAPACP